MHAEKCKKHEKAQLILEINETLRYNNFRTFIGPVYFGIQE